jgi:ABC-2 type transport system ATP-binding protein
VTRAAVIAATGTMIAAEGLTRRFGGFTAVDGVALAVAAGEVFGLLGANGAGKTTTIRMLCGLLPPTAGSMEVAGVDMVRHPRRARARIGYLAQRFALYGELTTAENLALQAGLYGLTGRRRRERLTWGLEHMGLAEHGRTLALDLPLGFQRRLSLAAALLHQPDVLFLDEPTSGVDPLARQQFWELIYELAEGGMGILVTTHYMDEAAFCDRLALMDAGRIVAEGSPAALVARPLPTPILEVRMARCNECAGALARWEEVREVIPHAGSLRVRLEPGADPGAVRARIAALARERGLELERVAAAEPDLEDVFVAVLEGQ